MTKMIIDNKATAEKKYECYDIDRNEYPTVDDLTMLAQDCMNDEVYLIRVYENETELFTIRNEK
jgi:hypothetical protein